MTESTIINHYIRVWRHRKVFVEQPLALPGSAKYIMTQCNGCNAMLDRHVVKMVTECSDREQEMCAAMRSLIRGGGGARRESIRISVVRQPALHANVAVFSPPNPTSLHSLPSAVVTTSISDIYLNIN